MIVRGSEERVAFIDLDYLVAQQALRRQSGLIYRQAMPDKAICIPFCGA
jgi:hypothetical protein